MSEKIQFWSLLIVTSLSFWSSACVRVATAPRRAAAQERAENSLARLAAIDPQQMADFQTRRMTDRLALDSAQQTTVAALNLRYAQRFHAIAAAEGSPRERWADLKNVEATKDAEVRGILTPSQQKNYEQLRAEMRDLVRERFGVN